MISRRSTRKFAALQGATGRICWPSSRPTNDRYSAREIHGASEVRPDSRGPRVAPAQHCAAFASDQKAVPEFSPRWETHSAPLIGSWEDLHGRNLTSALMRSRVHNRTGDRGGEPFRLTEGGIALGPSRIGPGALSQTQ